MCVNISTVSNNAATKLAADYVEIDWPPFADWNAIALILDGRFIFLCYEKNEVSILQFLPRI